MPHPRPEDVQRLFDVFGGGELGLVPISELAEILKDVGGIKPSAFNDILTHVDMNGDGFVNMDELVYLLEYCKPQRRATYSILEDIFYKL
eukprot:gnl/Chilomastix_caulleri/2430.p1 GENE.gnl/Chilomastix_caulleri/2430~~gnl/Chilomastix_caulleri/2430.p1  ORF type:complete len:90 (+),score=18.87 gnl/Chilomastix_caulleri/2430:70-339(+)